MGIGIIAMRENDQLLAKWAVTKYSTGNNLMDNAAAIKLAMITQGSNNGGEFKQQSHNDSF